MPAAQQTGTDEHALKRWVVQRDKDHESQGKVAKLSAKVKQQPVINGAESRRGIQ